MVGWHRRQYCLTQGVFKEFQVASLFFDSDQSPIPTRIICPVIFPPFYKIDQPILCPNSYQFLIFSTLAISDLVKTNQLRKKPWMLWIQCSIRWEISPRTVFAWSSDATSLIAKVQLLLAWCTIGGVIWMISDVCDLMYSCRVHQGRHSDGNRVRRDGICGFLR